MTESSQLHPLVFDLLWADPAGDKEEQILSQKGESFGTNEHRGGNTCVFGRKALSQFFRTTNINVIVRAHQPALEGATIQKNAQVLTVFSSVNYFSQYFYLYFLKSLVTLLWWFQ